MTLALWPALTHPRWRLARPAEALLICAAAGLGRMLMTRPGFIAIGGGKAGAVYVERGQGRGDRGAL
jgi:hypothetical protein